MTTNLNSRKLAAAPLLVGYTVLDTKPCACGRTHVRATGSFVGRADDIVTLRGIKLYPTQIEEGVRAVPGVGDEYEIVLSTTADGLDVMTIRVEHAEHGTPTSVIGESRGRSAEPLRSPRRRRKYSPPARCRRRNSRQSACGIRASEASYESASCDVEAGD